MIAMFNQAHEYIIEEDSLVIENKNGPYFGPEKDRSRMRFNQVSPAIDDQDIKAVNNYLKSGGWITEHKGTKN